VLALFATIKLYILYLAILDYFFTDAKLAPPDAYKIYVVYIFKPLAYN